MASSSKPREIISQYLTICQTALFNHLISISQQGFFNHAPLGAIPDEYTELEFNSIDYKMNSKVSSPKFISEISPLHTITDDSEQEYGEEASFSVSSHKPVTTIIFEDDLIEHDPLSISDESINSMEMVFESEKNDIPKYMISCDGVIKTRPKSPPYFEATFTETEEFKPKITPAFLRSELEDKLQALVHFENTAFRGKPAQFFDSANAPPAVPREVHYADRPTVLYAEVISYAVSKGGDGFVLNKGDTVTVVQFIKDHALIEVKWKGMQGLFHSHHFKLQVPNAVSSSVLSRTYTNLISKVLQTASQPIRKR